MPLPGMGKLPKTQNQKATDYIKGIYKTRSYQLHKNYFKNYMTKGYPVILAHIRNAYKKYVLSNQWTEDKFNVVIYVLISNERQLTNNAFENMGNEYDNGSIKSEQAFADYNNDEINEKADEFTEDDLYKYINGL